MADAVSRAERRQLEALFDRIEDRLHDAPEGWHVVGPPAGAEAVDRAGLSPAVVSLWERWDGVSLADGEIEIFGLGRLAQESEAARSAGLIGVGDVVIGNRRGDLMVLSADPWEDGADVVLVEDDGERSPYASTIGHLVLGELGELGVLYDEEGEFRGDLFDESDGELTPKVERRLLRRRLDLDPDAPMARFRLGQLLRRAGELRGAASELRAVIKRAPGYVWAQFELGRTLAGLQQVRPAERAFVAAAGATEDTGVRGVCLAWAAHVAEDPAQRELHASAARECYPGLAAAHEAGAREAVENEDWARASELVALGLAVNPRHLGLLDLARALPPSST